MFQHNAYLSVLWRFPGKTRRSLLVGLIMGFLLLGGAGARARCTAQTPTEVKPATQPPEPQSLEVGKPIERELAGGQRHLYQITLTEGQYLNVVVEQRGIDVAVALIGPDRKPLTNVNGDGREEGAETVEWVAGVAGAYQLTVQAAQRELPVGKYRVQVTTLRAATEQDHALQEARQLSAEYSRLYAARKYDEALPLVERALAIREKLLGPEHPNTTSSLNNLAALYRAKSDYAQAEPLYRRALTIREKVLGAEHPDTAQSLNNLAELYRAKGDYPQAEPLYRRALTIREKLLGAEHPSTAQSLNNLAELYRAKADYAQAEPLYRRALAIAEKVLGAEHPNTVLSLNNLAALYRAKSDYAQAEPLYQRALVIREKVLGPEHLDVAVSLYNLAGLYYAKRDYVKAEPLYQRALTIREKTLGPEHLDVANPLTGLANLYSTKRDYVKAEPMLQRALAIREKALGPEHALVVELLNSLANTYKGRSEYAKAEPLYQRALAIREKTLDPEHPNVALSLNNLANLYMAKGDYVKAEPLYQRSLAIREKTLGPEHPDVANSLTNLAILYVSKGDYAKAEPLYQRALAIQEKTLGPEHPNVAGFLNTLANLYRDKGDYAKAEPMLQHALAIQEKTLGPEHPEGAASLNDLANLYAAKGDVAQALAIQVRANKVSEHLLGINLATGSERQKLAYLATRVDETDRSVSLHVRAAPNDATARNLATTTILQRKGRALDATADSIGTLRRRFNAQDQALLDQWQDTNAQLARLVLGGPLPQMTPAEHQQQMKALEEQKEKDEAQISRRSAEFRAQSQAVTLQAIQAALPPQTALVEFYSYRPFNAKSTKRSEQFGPPHYVAYVLHQAGEVQWVELGAAQALDAAAAKLRQALRDPKRSDVTALARALDAQVMQPVRKLLGETKHVLLSPDGALNLIPFAALVDEEKRYLVERYSLSYLTSGRDLLRLQTHSQSTQGPLVLADPDFGGATGPAVPPEAATTGRAFDLSQAYFTPLPGTAQEAQALQALLPQATVLTRDKATEAALKQANSPSILHIATHGFFLEEATVSSASDGQRLLLQQANAPTPGLKLENPLLRSGLGLAGANLRQSGTDDGILTALEVAGLNLWGTKLVVLSACDTGVGEVKTGEGVYGLRRALVLAGSETQVMSLWPVSDKGTRDLMTEYYKALQAGQGRGEGLRQVQLKLLTDPKRAHPYYWASFIQSGEWANLEGKR